MGDSTDITVGSYGRQHRGGAAAYAAYFAGMDSSMQQKVALTTAHFPVRGRIADMGCGSGRGTYDLARLYRGLELVGVDINPVSVEMAAGQYRLPNLSYAVGDISEMVFPEESLDGVLDSSVLHHVTSFNDFDVRRVHATFDNQVAQLKPGGVIIVRDFVIPEGPETVLLDLPEGDGSDAGEVGGLSTAALFELFARDWRSSVNPRGPVPFARFGSPREGFVRYEVALRAAAEFVLRKDYRADWAAELLEEYTYLKQSEFEEAFRSRGLRVVTSMPLWNPWIVQHRFEGRFYLSDTSGRRLPFPPTNYLIVGEKVRTHDGVRINEVRSAALPAPGFLSLTAHRHRNTGKIYELAERPNLTLDLLPWFESEGQVFVFAKKDFPRPLVNARAEQARLNLATYSGYITEPISAIVGAAESAESAVVHILSERGGFRPDEVVRAGEPFIYYTSPGGINERVTSRLVEVRPRGGSDFPFPNYTQFKDAGTVRELDATQVLRACHVGGMFDARLEINIYRLFRSLGLGLGPWIGAPISLTVPPVAAPPSVDDGALTPAPRAAFDAGDLLVEPSFLSICEGTFAERDSRGNVLAEVPFEYVLPRGLSVNTLAALPVLRTAEGVFVGVAHRDLPAVQSFDGNSHIVTAPAWRLPLAVRHLSELHPFLAEAFFRDFRIRVRRSWELGGAYFSTPGVTPETVYPYVAEVEPDDFPESSLRFVRLSALVNGIDLIQDAHLLLTAYRLAHSQGCLPDPSL